MFGKTTIFHVKILNHPIETTIYKLDVSGSRHFCYSSPRDIRMMLFRHPKICFAQLSLRSRGTYPECRVEVATALCAATEHGCELPKCAYFCAVVLILKKQVSLAGIFEIQGFWCFFSCPSPCVFGHLWSWPHLFWSKWLSAQREWAVGLKHVMISPKHPSTCIKISEMYTENMMHSLPKDSDSSHCKPLKPFL